MKAERTKAIVLRRTNYGEADRIVQFITPLGRRSVMAKGVRREKSKLAGGIELFGVSDVVIGSGKGDLGILTSAKLLHFYRNILNDYERLQFGYLAIKLVARASETVDEEDWFYLLQETLAGIDVETVPLALVEAWFYLNYSSLLGNGLNLKYDVDNELLSPDGSYRYDSSEKGFRLVSSGEIKGEHIKLLRLIESKSLNVLVQIGGIGEILPVCLAVAREHASIDTR